MKITHLLLTIGAVTVLASTTYDLARVMAAIEKTESGGDPLAILDNTTHQSYRPKTKEEAVALLNNLWVNMRHNIDVGLMQINRVNFSACGVSDANIADLFNPAVRKQCADKVFSAFYSQSKKINGDTDLAVERAIGSYNKGPAALTSAWPVYVNKVLANYGSTNRPSTKFRLVQQQRDSISAAR